MSQGSPRRRRKFPATMKPSMTTNLRSLNHTSEDLNLSEMDSEPSSSASMESLNPPGPQETAESFPQNPVIGTSADSGNADKPPALPRKYKVIEEQVMGAMGLGALQLMKAGKSRGNLPLLNDGLTLVNHAESLAHAHALLCQANPAVYRATMKLLQATPYTLIFGELLSIGQEIAEHHGYSLSLLPPFIKREQPAAA